MATHSLPHSALTSNADSMAMAAPQPDLRAYIVYDEVPEDYFVMEVPDNSAAPHLRAGEFVLIDPEDRDPVRGEMFAISWKSSPDQSWEIVLMDQRKGVYVDPDGSRHMLSMCWRAGGDPLRFMDGPYDEDAFRAITHGKVVGIYQPDFRRQLGKGDK